MQPQNIFNAKYMQWIKYIYRPTRQIFKAKIYARHKIYAKHKLVCSTQNIYAKEKIHPVTKYMQATKCNQSKIYAMYKNIYSKPKLYSKHTIYAIHKIYAMQCIKYICKAKIYIQCQNICKTQYIKDIWLRLKQNMCTSRAINYVHFACHICKWFFLFSTKILFSPKKYVQHFSLIPRRL